MKLSTKADIVFWAGFWLILFSTVVLVNLPSESAYEQFSIVGGVIGAILCAVGKTMADCDHIDEIDSKPFEHDIKIGDEFVLRRGPVWPVKVIGVDGNMITYNISRVFPHNELDAETFLFSYKKIGAD